MAEKRMKEASGNSVSQVMDPPVLYIKYADDKNLEIEPHNNLKGSSSFD